MYLLRNELHKETGNGHLIINISNESKVYIHRNKCGPKMLKPVKALRFASVV